jgi:hypothetical protein
MVDIAPHLTNQIFSLLEEWEKVLKGFSEGRSGPS